MTENKNLNKKANSLPTAYVESITGLWQCALDMYYSSPNQRSDFWKLVSIACFFIKQDIKRLQLVKKNEELSEKIKSGVIKGQMALTLSRSINNQIKNLEHNRIFFNMLPQIKEDYEKALELQIEQHCNLLSDSMNLKTFDELVEMLNKPKAERNEKQALEILEANKFELLTDLPDC